MKNKIREWLELLGAILCLLFFVLAGGCATRKHLKECQDNMAQYANSRVMRGCSPYVLNGHEGFVCSHEIGNPAYGSTGYGKPLGK